MSIGGFIVASFFAIKGNMNPKFAWTGLWHGVLFLGVQGFVGPLYFFTISSYAPIIYDNILGLSSATFNIEPLFAAKIVMIGLLICASAYCWKRLQSGKGVVPKYALALGPMALVVAILGELMNDGGRFPYLVLTGNGGILPAEFINEYVTVPSLVLYAVVGTLLVFAALFMVTAYYALNRGFLTDLPS